MAASPILRDVAAHVGMGKSTVQRVLTGTGSVSPRTRKKITDTAARLGYVPNPFFSILSGQKRRRDVRSMKIAYIYRRSYRAGAGYFLSAAARGKALGYNLEQIELAELGAGTRLMDVLYHRGFAGVIIGQIPMSDHAAVLANTHLPLVCCGRIAPLPVHTVQADVTDMTRLAWQSMIKAGYRRIGAAVGMHVPTLEDDLDRLGTVLQCQVDISPRNRIPPLRTALGNKKALVAWVRRYKPDAVLAFSNAEYYTIRDSGMDMSRLGYASLHTFGGSREFAGVIEPTDSISREAVNLLDQLIRHRSIGIPSEPLHILVPGVWREGFSLPPV
jgi:DNA-binding LacI/PurR family transcriptional regulator